MTRTSIEPRSHDVATRIGARSPHGLGTRRMPLTLVLAIGCVGTWGIGCADDPATGTTTVAVVAQALTVDQCYYGPFLDNKGKIPICHWDDSLKKKKFVRLKVKPEVCASHVAEPLAVDFVAVDDNDCRGNGCLPDAAPCDALVPCCEGLICAPSTASEAAAGTGRCVEIDACVHNPCGPLEDCHDRPWPAGDDARGRTCTCKDGFERSPPEGSEQDSDSDSGGDSDHDSGHDHDSDSDSGHHGDSDSDSDHDDDDQGLCVPSCATGAVQCDDGNACTVDLCDAQVGCVTVAVPCNDYLVCNGEETCDPTEGCQPGTPPTIEDGNPCTTDSCDPVDGVMHVNNTEACDDGLYCNGADTCGNGACQHAGDPCANGDECADICNEADDVCFSPLGTPCSEDDDVCTTRSCNGAGACVANANNAACDDGNDCTATDTCSEGICVGSDPVDPSEGPVSCDSGNPCLPGSCGFSLDPETWEVTGGNGVCEAYDPCDDGYSLGETDGYNLGWEHALGNESLGIAACQRAALADVPCCDGDTCSPEVACNPCDADAFERAYQHGLRTGYNYAYNQESGCQRCCPAGYTGADCSADIDECADPAGDPCGANATCTNTQGGFECSCDEGFFNAASGGELAVTVDGEVFRASVPPAAFVDEQGVPIAGAGCNLRMAVERDGFDGGFALDSDGGVFDAMVLANFEFTLADGLTPVFVHPDKAVTISMPVPSENNGFSEEGDEFELYAFDESAGLWRFAAVGEIRVGADDALEAVAEAKHFSWYGAGYPTTSATRSCVKVTVRTTLGQPLQGVVVRATSGAAYYQPALGTAANGTICLQTRASATNTISIVSGLPAGATTPAPVSLPANPSATCLSATGCQVLVFEVPVCNCDDHLYCNGLETCAANGSCIAGTPPVVDDDIDCTIDQCDEVNDRVTHTPDDSLCPFEWSHEGRLEGQCYPDMDPLNAEWAYERPNGCTLDCPDFEVWSWRFFECTPTRCPEDTACVHYVPDAAGGTCSAVPRAAGTTCRAATGQCDVAEVCDGSSLTCPADAHVAAGTICYEHNLAPTTDACNGSGVCVGTCTSECCPTGTFGNSLSGGNGTTVPFTICTLAHLRAVSNVNAKFKQVADLDLAAATFAQPAIPALTGTYDGNGKTIRNSNRSLIGNVGSAAEIKNLTLEGVAITAGGTTGAVAGSVSTNGKVSAVVATGSISVVGGSYLGGLVGSSYGVISDCVADVDITGTDFIGGLVGYNQGTGQLLRSHASGDISCRDYCGGAVGRQTGVAIDCTATGDVSGQGNLGGFVGQARGLTANPLTLRCSATGSVAGYGYIVGGFAGGVQNMVVQECWSSGDVSAKNRLGGFAGESALLPQDQALAGQIRDNWSSGSVTGAGVPCCGESGREIGGFVGGMWQPFPALIVRSVTLAPFVDIGTPALAGGGFVGHQYNAGAVNDLQTNFNDCWWLDLGRAAGDGSWELTADLNGISAADTPDSGGDNWSGLDFTATGPWTMGTVPGYAISVPVLKWQCGNDEGVTCP